MSQPTDRNRRRPLSFVATRALAYLGGKAESLGCDLFAGFAAAAPLGGVSSDPPSAPPPL